MFLLWPSLTNSFGSLGKVGLLSALWKADAQNDDKDDDESFDSTGRSTEASCGSCSKQNVGRVIILSLTPSSILAVFLFLDAKINQEFSLDKKLFNLQTSWLYKQSIWNVDFICWLTDGFFQTITLLR